MSFFEKVVDFNFLFGVISSKKIIPSPNFIEEKPEETSFCMELIREEMKELEDAVKQKDYIETADALTDILYVVCGMGARLGVDLDKTFELVHQNNMSKLCITEEEAQETVKFYKDHYEKLGYDSPEYRYSGEYYIVYNKSTKKILKSIKWINVDLSQILDKSS